MVFSGLLWSQGPYVGDITALEVDGDHKVLFVGTGPRVLCFSIASKRMLGYCVVFNGVRVHGLRGSPISSRGNLLVVWGERQVKVLQWSPPCTLYTVAQLPPRHSWVMSTMLVPQSGQESQVTSSSASFIMLCGLSNSSVEIWSWRCTSTGGQGPQGPLLAPLLVTTFELTPRSLLYSMDLQLDFRKTGGACRIRAVAGTIFNEVVVFELPPLVTGGQLQSHLSDNLSADPVADSGCVKAFVSPEVVKPLHTLRGHEGSVYRVRWVDADTLVSTSDDRTARVWTIVPGAPSATGSGGPPLQAASPPLTLWGHSARVWDCQVLGPYVFTASEDCTTRIWDRASGRQLAALQGHGGRGVWRLAVCGPHLFTGGADGAVRLWLYSQWLEPRGAAVKEIGSYGGTPTMSGSRRVAWQGELRYPVAAGSTGSQPGTSKRPDYVRCLALCSDHEVLLATNEGHLSIATFRTGHETDHGSWQGSTDTDTSSRNDPTGSADIVPLYSSDERGPWLCMAVAPMSPGGDVARYGTSGWVPRCRVFLGHIRGHVAAVQLHGPLHKDEGAKSLHPLTIGPPIKWTPHEGSPVLSLFCCTALGPDHVLTSSATSSLSWWYLKHREQWWIGDATVQARPQEEQEVPSGGNALGSSHVHVYGDEGDRGQESVSSQYVGGESDTRAPAPVPVATAASPFSAKITSVDVQPDVGVLVCGDQLGNILVFEVPEVLKPLSLSHAPDQPVKLPLLRVFPHHHGSAPISVVQVHPHGDVITGGRDGCLASFKVVGKQGGGGQHLVAPCGLSRLTGVTTVQAVQAGPSCIVVGGLHARDFVVVRLEDDEELMRVECGGGRRPMDFMMAHCGTESQIRGGGVRVPSPLAPIGSPVLILAFYRDSVLHLVHQTIQGLPEHQGGSCTEAGSDDMVVLHSPHHGREVHCVSMLLLGSPYTAGWHPGVAGVSPHGMKAGCNGGNDPRGSRGHVGVPLLILTSSEDGSVRRMMCGGPTCCLSSGDNGLPYTRGHDGELVVGNKDKPSGHWDETSCHVLDCQVDIMEGPAHPEQPGMDLQPPLSAEPGTVGTTGITDGLNHNCVEVQNGSQVLMTSWGVPDPLPGSSSVPPPHQARSPSLWTCPEPTFQSLAQLGSHAAGTALRCHDTQVMPGQLGPREYLVVAGGAKEVLMVWKVRWEAAASWDQEASVNDTSRQGAPTALTHTLICTRDPPLRGLRPKSTTTGAMSLTSERRYIALAIVEVDTGPEHLHKGPSGRGAPPVSQGPCDGPEACPSSSVPVGSRPLAYVVVSSSASSLSLLCVDLVRNQWSTVARLVHHQCPVLSLSVCRSYGGGGPLMADGPLVGRGAPDGLGLKDMGGECSVVIDNDAMSGVEGSGAALLLASGATDGGVALWDLSEVVGQHRGKSWKPESSEGQGLGQGYGSGEESGGLDGLQGEGKGEVIVRPIWSRARVHQSGVNALVLVPTGGSLPPSQSPSQYPVDTDSDGGLSVSVASHVPDDAHRHDWKGEQVGKAVGTCALPCSHYYKAPCQPCAPGPGPLHDVLCWTGGDDQALGCMQLKVQGGSKGAYTPGGQVDSVGPLPTYVVGANGLDVEEGSFDAAECAASGIDQSPSQGGRCPGGEETEADSENGRAKEEVDPGMLLRASPSSAGTLAAGCLRAPILHDRLTPTTDGTRVVLVQRHYLPNAHGSAIKGMASAGPYVFTVGLDQWVRCWTLMEEPAGGSGGHACRPLQPLSGGTAEASAALSVPTALPVAMEDVRDDLMGLLSDHSGGAVAAAQLPSDHSGGAAAAAQLLSDHSELSLVGDELILREVGACGLEVLEPSCIDACTLQALGAGHHNEHQQYVGSVVVSGRGTQVLHWCQHIREDHGRLMP